MIREHELYHGAALARLILRSSMPIEVQAYGSENASSYVLNGNVGLFIKYSTNRMSPWKFTFRREHQDRLLEMKEKLKEVFLLLVCEEDGIVALSFAEIKRILDENHEETEWISATRRKREQYTVKGSDGRLDFKVADSDFPKRIIEILGT